MSKMKNKITVSELKALIQEKVIKLCIEHIVENNANISEKEKNQLEIHVKQVLNKMK